MAFSNRAPRSLGLRRRLPSTLFTLLQNGRSTPGVAVGSKGGHLFLLHRETGKPLFPSGGAPCARTDVPGEEVRPRSRTRHCPPALVPQSLTADQAWGPTERNRDACRESISALRNEGIFTPPSLRGSLIIPGNIGGLHWGGTAFDARHGLLIVPTNRMAAVVRLIPRDQVDAYRKANPDWETTSQRGTPYAMSRTFLRSPSGLSVQPSTVRSAVGSRCHDRAGSDGKCR